MLVYLIDVVKVVLEVAFVVVGIVVVIRVEVIFVVVGVDVGTATGKYIQKVVC